MRKFSFSLVYIFSIVRMGSLQEEELLDIALADYSQRRLRLIDERADELTKIEE